MTGSYLGHGGYIIMIFLSLGCNFHKARAFKHNVNSHLNLCQNHLTHFGLPV